MCWALSLGLGPQQGQKKPKFLSTEASVDWGMSQIHTVSHRGDYKQSIREQLVYSVVLVLGVQGSESVLRVHISTLF